jgi:hypothetical protein
LLNFEMRFSSLPGDRLPHCADLANADIGLSRFCAAESPP